MTVIILLLSAALLFAPLLSGIPDESLYSSVICALVLLATLLAAILARRGEFFGAGRERAEQAFAALLGIALLSLLWRVIADRGIAYLGPMLQTWIVFGVELALFGLTRRLAQRGRGPAYILVFVTLLASAIVGEIGVNEHLTHVRVGQTDWRIFATSTPDFLAGYLALLLPVTLALFVGVPLQKQKQPVIGFALAVLLLVVLGYQTASLVWTQSRFALVAVTIGLLVSAAALLRARRCGLILEPSSWWRLAGVGVFLVLIGVAFGRPLLNRLRHTSATDNSTAFRLYTWRGSLKMAAASPLLGTGVGTYVHLYPRYAITGFTRLAHNSYIQMADECGVPGLIALLVTLGLTLTAAWRGLSIGRPTTSSHGEAGAEQYLEAVAPADDRILLCGLLGGLSAAIVQNLIDSDWYVFFLGMTFWALAGLAVGLFSQDTSIPASGERRSKTLIGVGTLAILMLAWMMAQGIAATYDRQATAALAESATDPSRVSLAEQGWAEAMQWDPLNARYPGYLGFQVYDQREGRLADAEGAVRTAIRLEPSGLNYSLLADILAQQHRVPEAVAALQDGLRSDPNSLDLRLSLAQILPPPQATDYYHQITVLEDSPVGQVRAIGNVTEYKFAIADAAVADTARDPAVAAQYYARAQKVLEAYADEGGTTNIQRQVLIGDHPNPALDKQMNQLYARVMARQIALSPLAARPKLQDAAGTYAQKYAEVIKNASLPGIQ